MTNRTEKIRLRDVLEDDLPLFFEFQLDAEANHMAAFTAKNPADQAAFQAHWTKILNDETVTVKSIILGREVIGHVACFQQFEETEVTYWLGRAYWGKGLATQALNLFLSEVIKRPLFARAVKDNIASIRVLVKCGFHICGEDKGFANARNEEVEEYILRLDTAVSL